MDYDIENNNFYVTGKNNYRMELFVSESLFIKQNKKTLILIHLLITNFEIFFKTLNQLKFYNYHS